MLKWIMIVALIVPAIAAQAKAQAAPECTAPQKPDLPQNGAVLSAGALNAAADKVSAYSGASRAYQSCLDQVLKAPAKYTRTQWRAALKAYNGAAPGVMAVWDSYQKLSDDWVSAHLVKPGAKGQTKTASQ